MDDSKKYDFLLDDHLRTLLVEAEQGGSAENYSELAKAYNVRGMFPQALEAAERATELDEAHFTGWFEYAIAATTVGENHLRRILQRTRVLHEKNRLEQNEIKTAMALTHYYLSEDEEATTLSRDVIESGEAVTHTFEVLGYISYNSDDYKSAFRHFLEAVTKDDGNFRAHWMIGHCWFELDDLRAAAESYKKAIEIQPYFANAWFSLGKIYLVQDMIQPAYQCFNKCLSINPRMWDCYFTQADYYLGHRNYVGAITCCKRILELEPDKSVRAESLNYIGEAYLVARNYEEARNFFEMAIESDGVDAVPYNNLGVTLMKLDQLNEAIEYFKMAIKLNPNFAYPVTKLGQSYLMKKQLDKATKMFHKALEVDTGEYWAWLGLSEVHRKKRQYRKQLESVLKAVEICNDDSDVYNYLGIAFQSLRDYESAEKAYLRSLELDPFNRKTANNLGFLYERFLEKTEDKSFQEKAVRAWKQRLLICRDTGTSTKGAIKHLRRLGVEDNTIELWLREDSIT